ncbi:SGNH/GDSL hydrolase family protein [Microbacterium indicum]|uniref:SGNH/GDSL hydrolase family protein n=1 Tax=Microbacterium indicum TaxID=358100 RepID=UPI0003FF24BF|nr:SGNH/GDSL hydrolase family protein [Microbacterium indicum]
MPRSPFVPNEGAHPWHRYVAVGDSFTEGIGDPEPSVPGGFRGWADRTAEVLAQREDDFSYANLAVRGKLIRQIRDDQLDAALALQPDLITLCAGGNDVLRPGSDPDEIATILDECVAKLSTTGAAVVVFTGFDVAWNPVFRPMRGRIAIYNENVRAVAEKHDAIVADLWALLEIQDARFWATDRLHLNPLGHHEVARMVLRTLNVANDLQPMQPDPVPARTWRAARGNDLVWAREYFVPWVLRRLRHQSSGDGRSAKRPEAGPVA